MSNFPILQRKINGKRLVYLDNAATTQKPQSVISAISDYYENHNANVHRGIYTISEEATDLFERAREKVARFINANSAEEIIFTKGTTESLNRVAFEWAVEKLEEGDSILVSTAEHHSNLLPWQVVCERTGATLKFAEINNLENEITAGVKLIAIAHVSNVLGTIFPVTGICEKAKTIGAKVVVDGAQAVAHLPVDVQKLGCDFYAFSGHKMYGPMGIGVLWAKKELLEEMPPYEYGGGMIEGGIPEKFEAGTPNVAGAIGLAAAVEYLENIGMKNIRKHEQGLLDYALASLAKFKEIKILGPPDAHSRSGLISFVVEGVHSHDVAAILDSFGVAVRAGHHCAMPLHEKLKISGSVRASFATYNSREDVDILCTGLKEAIKVLRKE